MGKAIVVKGVDFSALNVGKVKLMSSDVIVVESIHIANKVLPFFASSSYS